MQDTKRGEVHLRELLSEAAVGRLIQTLGNVGDGRQWLYNPLLAAVLILFYFGIDRQLVLTHTKLQPGTANRVVGS